MSKNLSPTYQLRDVFYDQTLGSKKNGNGFNILSDWTTEKMRRFYSFCRVAHQNEPPEIDTTKDHCGIKGGIYDDWGHYHLILLQLCGIKQHSLDGKQQRFEWNSMKPATTKGDWNWIEIGIFTICGDKMSKGKGWVLIYCNHSLNSE